MLTLSRKARPEIIIAPHYYLVQEEFGRLQAKLKSGLHASGQPAGHEVLDGQATLDLWEAWLRTSLRRLPARLRRFSATILARCQRPDQRQTQRAVIALEQEINRLIHLHHQLHQHTLPPHLQEGARLLGLCLDKTASDLLDLFAFFIRSVDDCRDAGPGRPRTHVWRRQIDCRAELAAYRRWRTGLAGQRSTPPQGVARLASRMKNGLNYLIAKEKTKKAPCWC